MRGPRDCSRATGTTTYASWSPIGRQQVRDARMALLRVPRPAMIDIALHAPTIGRCPAYEHATDVRLPLEFRKKSAARARGGRDGVMVGPGTRVARACAGERHLVFLTPIRRRGSDPRPYPRLSRRGVARSARETGRGRPSR